MATLRRLGQGIARRPLGSAVAVSLTVYPALYAASVYAVRGH